MKPILLKTLAVTGFVILSRLNVYKEKKDYELHLFY